MPDSTPLVSVIIPTYNRPESVLPAVESVCAQTYPAVEAVVVDDRSSVPAGRQVREALMKRERVQFYVNDGAKGCAGARNMGLRVAKGEYVAFLDDDDQYLPDKLRIDVARLEENDNTDVVVSGARQEWCAAAEGGYKWIALEFHPHRLFDSCFVMCRREALRGLRFRCNYMEWRDIAFQLYDNGANVRLAPERLVTIASLDGSLSTAEEAMLATALANARDYCAKTIGRPEHDLFRTYLAKCEKNIANLRVKQGRLCKAAGGYVRSFRTCRDPRNLVPFA